MCCAHPNRVARLGPKVVRGGTQPLGGLGCLHTGVPDRSRGAAIVDPRATRVATPPKAVGSIRKLEVCKHQRASR